MEVAIDIKGLTRRFGTKLAVDHLTLEVYRGEVFGLLGHNGAGKTTTVRLLNGVLAPSDGSATVMGLSPVSAGPAVRRRSGVLTETPSLEERLTGRECLKIYADLFGVHEPKVGRRVEELLVMFDLADRADEKVGGYSKGMKQRLALARALLHEPEILYLDEPTASLDPVATRLVHTLIAGLSREEGRTVILCTHNLAEAQQLCHRVAVLERGRVLALGSPSELARRLMKTRRLEIEVGGDQVARGEDVLRGMDYLAAVTALDGIITITGVERERIPDIVNALTDAHVPVYRVQPQEPSLEDVYFTLYDGKEYQS